MDEATKSMLREMANRYETAGFIEGDPSWFMHQVSGHKNQETIAFLASVLSYGRRDLFLPKIQQFLSWSGNEPYDWVLDEGYRSNIPDDTRSFYRLYNDHMMVALLDGLHDMLHDYGSIGKFVEQKTPSQLAVEALEALSQYFYRRGIKGMVPSPHSSVAKRPCMFLRWMARDGSPVDLGLWADIIDKRSLFIPMDTHVLQEAHAIGLVSSKTASWSTVVKLTEALREVFPDDPVRGDFALFGYGVNKEK